MLGDRKPAFILDCAGCTIETFSVRLRARVGQDGLADLVDLPDEAHGEANRAGITNQGNNWGRVLGENVYFLAL